MSSIQQRVRSLVTPAAGGLLLALAVGGCGSDGGADVSKFIGTWQVTSGTATVTCVGQNFDQPLTNGAVTLAKGTDSALSATVLNCPIKFSVSGDVATAVPGQTCSTSFDLGTTTVDATITITSGTFKVSGATGTLVQKGTATAPFACTYEINATSTKTSADASPPDVR